MGRQSAASVTGPCVDDVYIPAGAAVPWPVYCVALQSECFDCGAAEIMVSLLGGLSVGIICHHVRGQDLVVNALLSSSQDSVTLLKEVHVSQVSVDYLKQLPGLNSLVVWSSESLLELQ